MLLQGQRFVVTGIASKLSIAWAIAEALHREGASLILTYPNDKIKKRVDMAAEKFEADLTASIKKVKGVSELRKHKAAPKK